ncbi:MAG: ATPase, T2SS/T4P/T4SS family [Christensenellales bacterium]|jgi:stage III sporulation protein AA
MLGKILPLHIFKAIDEKVSYSQLNEIRLRVNQPVLLYLGGQPYYLGEKGITSNQNNAFVVTKEQIDDIVFAASGFSIYSVNEQIKRGFLVIDGGIRIGICGDVVMENGVLKTITNFTSLNIRIPHEVKNCCLDAFGEIVSDLTIKNTLVVSPPGAGKTTFIRDFVNQLSEQNYCINVLVIDERGEISGGGQLNLGKFADVLSFTNKYDGFMQGIRALNPNLIVTDELGGQEDVEALMYAMNCGVSVLATVHAANMEDLKQKSGFNKLLQEKYFSRFVFLSNKQGPGTIEGIYNQNLSRISTWS